MKICVFGAGAIGGHLAVRLVRAGAETSVVARGATLAALRAGGLTLEAKDGHFTVPVRAESDPAALGPQDVVVMAVKAPSLPAAAPAIAPLLGPETAVVFAMNGIPWWYFLRGVSGELAGRALPGVDPGGVIARAIAPERAIGGVIYSACTVLRPGVVHVENRQSRLILGEPDGAISARLETLARLLASPGMAVEVTPRIRDAIWAKLLLNLTSGPFSVLTGAPPRDLYADPVIAATGRAILAEGQAIAAALGCRAEVDAEAQVRQYLGMSHKPSILQDLELGRAMEIDALLTTPLDLARLANVATPVLDLLTTLVRLRAEAAGLYRR